MRLAIISDIHANFEALEAVFGDIDAQKVDEVVCLGDIVGYGPAPDECIQLVRKRCPLVLQGNHDAAAVGQLSTNHFNIHAKIAIEWTVDNLTDEGTAFLSQLPLTASREGASLVHATPYEPGMWYYITSLEEAAFNFQFFDMAHCFIGHTHLPIIVALDKEKEVYVHQDTSIVFDQDEERRFLINVGSVGQPRDRNPRACYGIFDTTLRQFSYRRVEYDVKKTQARMRKAKMPEFLIMRLEDGR